MHIYIYSNGHICIHIHPCTYIHVQRHTNQFECMSQCTHECKYIHKIYNCIFIYIYLCLNIYRHTHQFECNII